MKNKISFQLIIIILTISFIVTLISIYIQVTNQYKNKISSFETTLKNIEKDTKPILSKALWNVDEDLTKILLNNFISHKEIVYVKIIESTGKSQSAGEEKKTNTIKREFKINFTAGNQTYEIGKLIAIVDLTPTYKELKEKIVIIIITEIVKMLLISLSIIFAIKTLITNKLEMMALYAKKLSLENIDKPLTTTNKKDIDLNEIGIITKAINEMRLNLMRQIKESQEQSKIMFQQSKLAAMGEMIGNIAHQWRQPLSLITTASSGIQLNHQIGQLNEEKINDFTRRIINAANYLSDTIDDFRNFFKPDKEKQYFNISNTFEKTFALLDSQFKNNNINTIKNINDTEIYGYENELIQVLLNILKNSKDELIKKKEQKLFIFIDVLIDDENITISIKDNAGGIKKEIIDRIFEPYFTTKSDKEGTGIGLYMSQEIIVKHMKGQLLVQNIEFTYENKKYKGAEFKIIINKSR